MAALATSQLVTTRAGFGLGDASSSMFRPGVQGLRGSRASSPAATLSVRTSARAAPRQQHRRAQRGARFPSLVVCATGAGMNVVFVGAEMAPWSKTGGLGDVLGGLPPAMAVSPIDRSSLPFSCRGLKAHRVLLSDVRDGVHRVIGACVCHVCDVHVCWLVQANGHRVMVISPRYDQYKDAWDTSVVSEVLDCSHLQKRMKLSISR